jgi:TM2 domain-containing membrane protein YozV
VEPAQQGRGKQKVIAGLLGVLLGSLGIHHFYLGSNTAGIIELGFTLAMMVFTVITCGIGGLIAWAACVPGLIEGILLLVMDDAEFDRRYNQRTPGSTEFVFAKPA